MPENTTLPEVRFRSRASIAGAGVSEFRGVLPEYDGGDFLSLVRCTVPVDRQGTHVDSPTAEVLLSAIAASRRAESGAPSRSRLASIHETL